MLRKTTFALGLLAAASVTQAAIDISDMPLFVSESVPPLNMLVMGRDHKLYYEAYNDASDLNGDGVIDVGYKGDLAEAGNRIDYYGYFNSHVCYDYDGDKFTPASRTETKKCSGKWSGDFLNYLTTSRMDALRKVLYGGYRATDTTTETVLQATFIPQDAHTWGKEYLNDNHDGYSIADYTPYSEPEPGYRHLFAVVSLTDGGIPQLRTLTNTSFRVWNWVSQERPVAGDQCTNSSGTKVSCTSEGVGGEAWSIVPAEMLSDLTLTTWRDNSPTATTAQEMNSRFSVANQAGNRCGTGPFSPPINTPPNFSNPYTGTSHNNCTQDNYHTLIKGKLTPTTTGTYEFSVDGDDAVDFVIVQGGARHLIAHRYGDTGASNQGGAGVTGEHYLQADQTYDIEVRHEENGGDASFRLYWKTPATGTTEMVDRSIRVAACPDNASLREDNCVAYANGKYKPTGILHDYGATDKMYFGLLSGSYEKNISGGVLRSQLQSFSREFDAATGRFCSSASNACSADDAVTSGIVDTINKFRVIDFNYANQEYGCGWIATRPITQTDTCYMWGNPIGEMMYETMRYFSGAAGPTAEYDYSSGQDSQSPLELPKVDAWISPYETAPQCAVPVMTVISDINPSYDYKLPGSHWDALSGSSNPSSISSLNVSTEADKIWEKEGRPSGPIFIGESNNTSDGAPTAKAISNFSTIRGLAPEEPTKQGTYYSAAIAHFGANNNIGGNKSLLTYAVALASPLPTFEFPVGGNTVTIVPFAKSVGGNSIDHTADFQPTNQIVDFYVETIANTDTSCPSAGLDCDATVNEGRPYAKFRINFEDVEQGADHDMDAIALYEIIVNTAGELVINMTSEYAAGGIDQHMGYVISGTTKDGIYLEVKDQGGSDIAYKLDTPEGKWAGECAADSCEALSRLNSSRTFTVSGSAANFLENPLWYAAKYGTDANNIDIDNDGVPDNYFLVTNALTLKDQLAKAFNDITQRNASVTNPSVDTLRNNTAPDEDTAYIYRTVFDVEGWTGDLIKEEKVTSIDPITEEPVTQMRRIWSAESELPAGASRKVLMASRSNGLIDFSWDQRQNAKPDLEAALNGDGYGQARVNYLKGQSCTGMVGCNTFRTRASRLGDIVNSSPVLVKGAQYLAYRADALDGTAGQYRAFQARVADHPPMVYVGANDGMLHAFNADSGKEVFAFIPTPIIPHLPKLTAEDYGDGVHQFYVDGTPVVADAYYANDWHTVLLGSLGAGGRGVFALDVTDPAQPKLLWEFTGDDDADMGYSIPQPTIARLHNGKWAALIPNGYNSASASEGKAVLFIVDIESGQVIRKLEAQTSEADGSISNGLSSIRTADFNGDGVVDYAYAGDLRGNLWRFDLLDNSSGSATPFAKTPINPDKFRVSFGGNPLFVAMTDDSVRQPITATPSLVRHPTATGYLVVAGTGRYLGITDKTSTALQTVYGIWDRQTEGQPAGSTQNLSRIALQEQTITENTMTVDGVARTVRLLSEEAVSWYRSDAEDNSDQSVETWGWFVDLKTQQSRGERVINDMRIYGDGLVFSTITPNADPCSAGLDGFVYAINPSTGGRTLYNVFDLSGDGLVNTDDSQEGEVVSGLEAPAGGWNISKGELYFTDGSSIKIAAGSPSSGRQTWRMIPSAAD